MRQLKITKQVTNRDSIAIDKYLHEISKYDLITLDEEIELSEKIKQGDDDALNKLVRANLRFVVSVAKQYQNQGMNLSDLISEGNLGLIKAAERFDASRGFKFISYAVWWIRQSILQALAEHSRIVRLPLNKQSSMNKINRAFYELEQKFEREPQIEEIAESLSISPEDVKRSLLNVNRVVSMDTPLKSSEDESNSLYDVIENKKIPKPDKKLMDDSLKREIERVLDTLNPREAEILKMYYGLLDQKQKTLEEISQYIGLTKERIRQIKERAIQKLKSSSRNKLLKKYL
jgi:RNA polymerase primary sigma factor